MTDTRKQRKLHTALRRFNDARDALDVAIRSAYPVGSLLSYSIRRGDTLFPIEAEVVGHAPSWNPGRISVRNVRTGKVRDIDAADPFLWGIKVKP